MLDVLGNIGGLADAIVVIGQLWCLYFATDLAQVKMVHVYQRLSYQIWKTQPEAHFDYKFIGKLFLKRRVCCCVPTEQLFDEEFDDGLKHLDQLDKQMNR